MKTKFKKIIQSNLQTNIYSGDNKNLENLFLPKIDTLLIYRNLFKLLYILQHMNQEYTLKLAPTIVPSKHHENNQNCSRRVLHSNRIFNFLRGTRRMKNRLARERIRVQIEARRNETKGGL